MAVCTLRGAERVELLGQVEGEQCGYESVMEFLVKGVEDFDHHRERMRDLRKRS